ncbi:sce7726 family protein [Emcibacter nanhaiensis]|uniref:Sce7726 family protein n=1 Tax=Emcibacter nanhaiensis TaxID=1505037 RepID=A0A501PBY0_9PROT|nr:sce7726 family protein [Emcibacter nanhaiensis]TPD57384.1 sce7726 family protein [Emcibacter nanhaiensis]
MQKNTKSENELKALILNHLVDKRHIPNHTILASEMPINRLKTRADLAILSNDFIGIEIKSEGDKLSRLEKQIESYKTVFDKIIVFAHEKHLQGIRKILSKNIGILVTDGYSVKHIRAPKQIRPPLKSLYLKNMKNQNIKRLIRNNGLANKKSREFSLAEKLKLQDIIGSNRKYLREEYKEFSDCFWKSVNKAITPEDIQYLSPRYYRRQKTENHRESEASFWVEWRKQFSLNIDDLFYNHCNQQLKTNKTNPFGPIPQSVQKLISVAD